MPIVGTSAYGTAGQITPLVRALLNDTQGNLFTDGLLMPYLNSAYRKVQRALAIVRQGTFIADNGFLIVPKVVAVDPSMQVVITEATAPPNNLPSDLLMPLKLWERQDGSNDDFVEMSDMTDRGGLPSIPQQATLAYWEWRNDGLTFIGATQDQQIRMRYEKSYPDLVDASSSILIRNAQDAIAFFAAAMAGLARGSPVAAQWMTAGDDALEDLLQIAIHREQNVPRRRKPFSWGRRGI